MHSTTTSNPVQNIPVPECILARLDQDLPNPLEKVVRILAWPVRSFAFSDLEKQALLEGMDQLPKGCRHTLITCLLEWAANRLSENNLIIFVRSISWQSSALSGLFIHCQVQDGQLLTHEEMAVSILHLIILFACLIWNHTLRISHSKPPRRSAARAISKSCPFSALRIAPPCDARSLQPTATTESSKRICSRRSASSPAAPSHRKRGCDSCASSSVAALAHRASSRYVQTA